ncbi:MAG: hypothetical protein QGI63_12700 [Rhodospirillales bacterium]|nr:hypothetical protein [Rhodospirillales bacterium]
MMAGQTDNIGADVMKHLTVLNGLVSQTHGTPGKEFHCADDIYYASETNHAVDAAPDGTLSDKRAYIAEALSGRRSLLETTFHAGHSALLALSTYPTLHYTAVDSCQAAYSEPCARYLAEVFGERFFMFRGDPRDVLPRLATHHRDAVFDAFRIDDTGDQGSWGTGIANILRLAPLESLIILDDVKMPEMAEAYGEYVKLGWLRPVKLKGFEDDRRQAVAILTPERMVSVAAKLEKETRGFVYAATGKDYVEEVVRAVRHTRQHHRDTPIIVFTDAESQPPTHDRVADIDVTVRALENPVYSVRDKIKAMRASPFERTLLIDTDTVIVDSIDEIFDALDHFEVLASIAPYRRMFAWESDALPECMPQLNAGVIAFRLGREKRAFFDIWEYLDNQYPEDHDQPSFRLALIKARIRYGVLPPEYNFRAEYPQFAGTKVKLFHCHQMIAKPDFAKEIIETVNKDAKPRVWPGHGIIAEE